MPSLDDIYALIPRFECEPGCTACCRTVEILSMSPEEARRIRAWLRARGREPEEPRDGRCAYVSDRGCTIHPVRPLICRMYGNSPNHGCMKGVRPVELLHEDLEAEIWQLYRSTFM